METMKEQLNTHNTRVGTELLKKKIEGKIQDKHILYYVRDLESTFVLTFMSKHYAISYIRENLIRFSYLLYIFIEDSEGYVEKVNIRKLVIERVEEIKEKEKIFMKNKEYVIQKSLKPYYNEYIDNHYANRFDMLRYDPKRKNILYDFKKINNN